MSDDLDRVILEAMTTPAPQWMLDFMEENPGVWAHFVTFPDDWDGEHCQVCGDAYDDVYWLPDAWWERITPKPEQPGAGLLCPDCALMRLQSLVYGDLDGG